jgi:NADH:ubiquinone reductase (H+-translocating)
VSGTVPTAMSRVTTTSSGAHRVVIVGGGFGGLEATLGLRRARVEMTLVDRRNCWTSGLFPPLRAR